MVVPPAAGKVPPEAQSLYGDRFEFIAAGVNIAALDHDNYNAAVKRIPAAVDDLVARGAEAIGVMGTSLTFVLGREFDDRLTRDLKLRTGLPVVTMASSIVNALHAVGATSLALAAAYDEEITQYMVTFLTGHGFRVTGVVPMGMVAVGDVLATGTANIVDAGKHALEGARPDALVISCGGLQTIEATEQLEDLFDLPVISSAVAGPWGAVRLLGDSGVAAFGGRLLRTPHASNRGERVNSPPAPR
jgi:arylmalonate decarboxylase